MSGLLLTSVSDAQPVWETGPTIRKGVQIELTRGFWDDPDNSIGFATAHGFVSGSFPVGEQIHVVLELPFSNGRFKSEFIDNSFLIGNPRVSLHHVDRSFDFRIGVQVPAAGDDGGLAASLPSLAENGKIWSFFPDVATVEFGTTVKKNLNDGLSLRAHLMPQVVLVTDCSGCDPELFLVHGIGIRSTFTQVEAGLGVTGISWISEEDTRGSIADGGYMIGGALALRTKTVIPELLIRLPLDDDVREMASAFVTLNLKVTLD